MHARAMATAALIAGALVSNESARAQTIATVEHVMVGVSSQTKQLDAALSNLGELSKGLRGADAVSVGEVTNAGREFRAEQTSVGRFVSDSAYRGES